MWTSWHFICTRVFPSAFKGREPGRNRTQSENAVRKDGLHEKGTCNDVEYRRNDFAVGHDGDGADVLPGRGGVSEGHADADRPESGCSGTSLAGWCAVPAHPVPAPPGHPVTPLSRHHSAPPPSPPPAPPSPPHTP